MSVTPEEWSNDLRTNFVEGAKKFIDLSKLLHLADPHTMQTSAHVEYESKNWACVFHITNPLMSIANLVKSWCKKDKAALSPIFNYLVEQLASTSNATFKKVTEMFVNIKKTSHESES